ncbi:ABC transporter substrate-binding protein [Natronoarchaeum sp. GCM10025321]|uniref:ABC transporter substrate-binding protein n=1 Tax=Natronoarchaeum sp. GCM10025321 TaxID=3252684 RepID=UPI00360B6211
MENTIHTESDAKSRLRSVAASRREFLVAGGATAGVALSGCLGQGSEDDENGNADEDDDNDNDSDDNNGNGNEDDGQEELTDVTYRHRYIRTGIGTGLNDAGVELGTWEEEGLNVDFQTSNGGAAKAVASGNDMFGNDGISEVLGLNEEGGDLVVIGQLLDPMGGVVTTGEQGITTWSDLEGKTVGEFPFGSTGPEAKAAMRKKDVDISSITFQNVQPGNGERLLRTGDLDAMIKFFPLAAARLEHAGLSPNVLITSQVLDYLGIVLYTRREVVENNPDMVNSFVRGWLKAYQIFANRIDEVLEIYKPLAAEGFDEEIQRGALGEYYAAQVPDPSIGTEQGKGWISPEKMEQTIDTFTEAGLIEGDVSAEEMYDNQFIDNNQELAVETANEIYDALEQYDIGPNYI